MKTFSTDDLFKMYDPDHMALITVAMLSTMEQQDIVEVDRKAYMTVLADFMTEEQFAAYCGEEVADTLSPSEFIELTDEELDELWGVLT